MHFTGFYDKLISSFTTIGTNDSAAWYAFQSYASQYGGINLYHGICVFNHPPFMIHMLRIMSGLTSLTGISFYFWLRLPAILADIGSVVLVVHLLKSHLGDRFSPAALMLLALAPGSIMLSGFHGNTDPLMFFFVLLAIYFVDLKPNIWLAGIAFGMSMNIKVVPIIFLPALLLYLPNQTRRLQFLILVGLTFIIAGLPYTAQDPVFIATRLFGYDSIYGDWGRAAIVRISHYPF